MAACVRSSWKTTGSSRNASRTVLSSVRVKARPSTRRKLNLDSTGAYSVASHTAETSHVTFASASYTLRTDDRGNPTWVVTLADRRNRPVGTIHISANDGRVSRVEGMYQGRNMEQVEEYRDDVDNAPSADEEVQQEEVEDADENIVKRDIKRLFRRTRADARRMFTRVKRSFKDFVAR